MNDRGQPLTSYLSGGHRDVDGWLEPGAMALIVAIDRAQRALGVAGHFAEIGIHHGKLFVLLSLLRRDGERGLAIDLFADQAKNVDGSGGGDEARFRANLSRHGDGDDHVIVVSADSSSIDGANVRGQLGGPTRWFSVDGGHTPELTHHDLETAVASLASGGVIVLDDYFHELWPGVSEGTNRWFQTSKTDVVPFAIGANKVFLTRSRHASYYRDAIAGETVGSSRLTTTMFGSEVTRVDFAPLGWLEKFRQSPCWQRTRDTLPGRWLRAALAAVARR